MPDVVGVYDRAPFPASGRSFASPDTDDLAPAVAPTWREFRKLISPGK
jgi:hypothetical protein